MTTAGVLRKLLPYTSVGLLFAILYVGWVFYSRWQSAREAERAAQSQQAEQDRKVVELYGNGGLKVLSFYANPGILHRGEKTLLCYGVANAKTVELDPPVEKLWPSLNRCFEVAPVRETRFTLRASDTQGRTATESLVVQVK